jgi:hypothetical protein
MILYFLCYKHIATSLYTVCIWLLLYFIHLLAAFSSYFYYKYLNTSQVSTKFAVFRHVIWFVGLLIQPQFPWGFSSSHCAAVHMFPIFSPVSVPGSLLCVHVSWIQFTQVSGLPSFPSTDNCLCRSKCWRLSLFGTWATLLTFRS